MSTPYENLFDEDHPKISVNSILQLSQSIYREKFLYINFVAIISCIPSISCYMWLSQQNSSRSESQAMSVLIWSLVIIADLSSLVLVTGNISQIALLTSFKKIISLKKLIWRSVAQTAAIIGSCFILVAAYYLTLFVVLPWMLIPIYFISRWIVGSAIGSLEKDVTGLGAIIESHKLTKTYQFTVFIISIIQFILTIGFTALMYFVLSANEVNHSLVIPIMKTGELMIILPIHITINTAAYLLLRKQHNPKKLQEVVKTFV